MTGEHIKEGWMCLITNTATITHRLSLIESKYVQGLAVLKIMGKRM